MTAFCSFKSKYSFCKGNTPSCKVNKCFCNRYQWQKAEPLLSSEVAIEGYHLISMNRSRKGGGVACFVKNSAAYSH